MTKRNQTVRTQTPDSFGGGLRLLYPSLADKLPGISPLVCIARDIFVDCGSCTVDVAGIFVSPAGHAVFVMPSGFSAQEASSLGAVIRSWSSDDLDGICARFTYQAYGQSYRIVDLLAQRGHLSFSGAADFISTIEQHIDSGRFILLRAA